ncbi:putative transposase [Aurantimonas sp. 22II-16-19i]|nr:putative transposase [Aurantimonas sp. 22II-16-19i]
MGSLLRPYYARPHREFLTAPLSITMRADFCIEAVEEALARFRRPEIFNTDQGSQFTASTLRQSCSPGTSRSAWTARAPGATISSSSGSGIRSKTRRFVCGPTRPSAMNGRRSADTLTFTTGDVRIHCWEEKRSTRSTSTSRFSQRRKPGRRSTCQAAEAVQRQTEPSLCSLSTTT